MLLIVESIGDLLAELVAKKYLSILFPRVRASTIFTRAKVFIWHQEQGNVAGVNRFLLYFLHEVLRIFLQDGYRFAIFIQLIRLPFVASRASLSLFFF